MSNHDLRIFKKSKNKQINTATTKAQMNTCVTRPISSRVAILGIVFPYTLRAAGLSVEGGPNTKQSPTAPERAYRVGSSTCSKSQTSSGLTVWPLISVSFAATNSAKGRGSANTKPCVLLSNLVKYERD